MPSKPRSSFYYAYKHTLCFFSFVSRIITLASFLASSLSYHYRYSICLSLSLRRRNIHLAFLSLQALPLIIGVCLVLLIKIFISFFFCIHRGPTLAFASLRFIVSQSFSIIFTSVLYPHLNNVRLFVSSPIFFNRCFCVRCRRQR